MTKNYTFFDIESHNSGREFSMPPHEFVRTFQYAVNDGPVEVIEVHTEEDLERVRNVLRAADFVVGHNILSFDLPAIFGDSLEPLHMALNHKVICTFYLANLITPAPYSYEDSKGHKYFDAAKPENAMKWLSLENLTYQFGLPGKFGSMKELAKPYQPAGTKVADYDYSLIPLSDPDFRYYMEQDVIAGRALYHYLISEVKRQKYPGDYIWREMEAMSATCGTMSRNGILVNQDFAKEKIQEMQKKKDETLSWLQEKYDFPTEGKAPWATTAGKTAVYNALAEYGISPKVDPEWPKTPTGAPQLSGENLMMFTKGTEAEELGVALASLKGQRSIPQQILENMKEDGRVHPSITALQRSGRWSVTKPGITVMGDRTDDLKLDKKILMAAPGKVLAGFDFSNADARAMAALSGDPAFAKRFEKDENGDDLYDGHNLTGEVIFGDSYYDKLDKKGKPYLRPAAKMAGHSQNYNIGAFKLALQLNLQCRREGLDLHFWAPKPTRSKLPAIEKRDDSIETAPMIENFNKAFPWLKLFKDKSVEEGSTGFVTNSWGRRMTVDKDREFTQGPALHGQSVTAEMMRSAILRLVRKDDYYARALRCIIHDELLMELDEDRVEEDIKVIKECMEVDFEPHTQMGVAIPFPVGYGYGKTWFDANH